MSQSEIFTARAAHETTAPDFCDGASRQRRSCDTGLPASPTASAAAPRQLLWARQRDNTSKLLVPSKIWHFWFLIHQIQPLYDKFAEEKTKEGVKKPESRNTSIRNEKGEEKIPVTKSSVGPVEMSLSLRQTAGRGELRWDGGGSGSGTGSAEPPAQRTRAVGPAPASSTRFG